jgi:hypothetical protein
VNNDDGEENIAWKIFDEKLNDTDDDDDAVKKRIMLFIYIYIYILVTLFIYSYISFTFLVVNFRTFNGDPCRRIFY